MREFQDLFEIKNDDDNEEEKDFSWSSWN